MKLKQFIIPVAGALLLGGCEADHRNDNLPDSVVYLLESDLQKALFYDIEETIDYSFRAFSSGYTVTPSEPRDRTFGRRPHGLQRGQRHCLYGARSRLLPAGEQYGIGRCRPPLDDVHRAGSTARRSSRLGDLTSYVIPLRLTSSSSKVNEEPRQHPDQSRDGGDPGAGSKRRRGGVRSGLLPDARLHRLRRIRQQVGDHDRIRLRRRSARRLQCRARYELPADPDRRRHLHAGTGSKWASARPCRISRSTSRRRRPTASTRWPYS